MLVDLAWPVAVAVDAVLWATWSALVGWRQARRPWTALVPGRAGRIRPWERGGQWYVHRLRMRRWKGWLPEAGTWFGGLSKRNRPSDSDGGWKRLAAECLRGERTHTWILAITPVLLVWNPWWLWFANLAFALVANLPCWVVVRSTRARLEVVGRGRRAQA